jgi:hypothetical protein
MRKIHKEQNFNSNRRGLYVNMLPISLPLTLPPLPFSNHRHITGFLLMKSSYILFSPLTVSVCLSADIYSVRTHRTVLDILSFCDINTCSQDSLLLM